MYYNSGYSDVIGRLVEVCMNEAVDQVKALPCYDTNGEVSIQEVRYITTTSMCAVCSGS